VRGACGRQTHSRRASTGGAGDLDPHEFLCAGMAVKAGSSVGNLASARVIERAQQLGHGSSMGSTRWVTKIGGTGSFDVMRALPPCICERSGTPAYSCVCNRRGRLSGRPGANLSPTYKGIYSAPLPSPSLNPDVAMRVGQLQ
jgi:hypothetical protein